MKFKKNVLFALSLVFLLLSACSANKNLNELTPQYKWEKAEAFFNKKKYARAVPFYQQLILERNSSYTAEAQMKLGDCYFNDEKYSDAVFEYQELLRLFPDYKEANNAQFNIGISYYNLSESPHYTQDETNKAIDAFQEFIDKYPWDQRKSEAYNYIQKCQHVLLEKSYLAGYIYYKTEDYSSALMYFNEIIELGNKDKLELKSLYYSGLIYYERKNLDDLYNVQEKLKADYPDSKECKTIIEKTVKLDKKLKK